MSFEMQALIALGIPASGVFAYSLYIVRRLKRLEEQGAREHAQSLPAE